MARKSQDKYIAGDWNAICDVCGFKYKASQLKKRWDGYWVCSKDWEERHPQDFLKSVEDKQSVSWTRVEPDDEFVTGLCTVASRSAIAGLGTAGCMIAGANFLEQQLDGTYS